MQNLEKKIANHGSTKSSVFQLTLEQLSKYHDIGLSAIAWGFIVCWCDIVLRTWITQSTQGNKYMRSKLQQIDILWQYMNVFIYVVSNGCCCQDFFCLIIFFFCFICLGGFVSMFVIFSKIITGKSLQTSNNCFAWRHYIHRSENDHRFCISWRDWCHRIWITGMFFLFIFAFLTIILYLIVTILIDIDWFQCKETVATNFYQFKMLVLVFNNWIWMQLNSFIHSMISKTKLKNL